ncbi:MAG: transcriptional repressor NrdR [Deltaproteobacteria bacterium]|nr:transcriptional repressor NrdR [Deltaproteobacteria bacterium]MCD6138996.1 transcriptional repressor NrdR [Deltaproteobacteria bacterium]RLB90482.1 MAG: transcriptional regulator NrdR [Deltaproteobacteria bacterium]RLB96446.1 MAG: transcriptional regulator NrdR [Deltaproteobacteria bacterium]RLC12378.1 MAG: transcriptional regulator NrdR [Deltaproteobacteria bacterium]
MKCPYCSKVNSKVVDSRIARDGDTVRRRRECLSCSRRFTTYERVERLPLVLIKKDGRRERFNRTKVLAGMQKACEKRNISINTLEQFVDELEKELQEMGEKEIPSSVVGELVMRKLHDLDDVAYVRFASVYREFKDINDFMAEVRELLDTPRKSLPAG